LKYYIDKQKVKELLLFKEKYPTIRLLDKYLGKRLTKNNAMCKWRDTVSEWPDHVRALCKDNERVLKSDCAKCPSSR